jgi:hypothetical protein
MRLLHTGFLGSLSCDTLFMGMGMGDCIAWRSTPPLPIVSRLAIRGNLEPFSPCAVRVRSAGKKKPGEGGFRPGFPITDKSFVADSTPHN